jgi:hypothetical protein
MWKSEGVARRFKTAQIYIYIYKSKDSKDKSVDKVRVYAAVIEKQPSLKMFSESSQSR